MIVFDHNVPRDQIARLRRSRIRGVQVGFEVGRPEWLDQQEIVRFLHRSRKATFVTRDTGFFRARLCHTAYCVVVHTGPALQIAIDIRGFFSHRAFCSHAQRAGLVVELSPRIIRYWRRGQRQMQKTAWAG